MKGSESTPKHLRKLLDSYDKRTDIDQNAFWLPPKVVLERLLDPHLKQRDRIEILIAQYAYAHGGNSPSAYELSDLMGISHRGVLFYIDALRSADPARAYRRHGRLFLTGTSYHHPLLDGPSDGQADGSADTGDESEGVD